MILSSRQPGDARDAALLQTIETYARINGMGSREIEAIIGLRTAATRDRMANPSKLTIDQVRSLQKRLHIPKEALQQIW